MSDEFIQSILTALRIIGAYDRAKLKSIEKQLQKIDADLWEIVNEAEEPE